MKHTPTPWHVDPEALPAMQGGAVVRGPAGYRVAETYNGDVAGGDRPGLGNAEFIVLAANCHEELVAALQPIAAAYSDDPGTSDLYNEQPVTITLGDVRRVWRALGKAGVR
jgi:hypothetical protein